jgi:hypothetical protein
MADGITRIAVEGFKSIVKRQEIEIAPLTILAGANSSGKSSIMQPLLMLKQTLEATYDPGPAKIDGPNVAFTSSDQFLSKIGLSGRRSLRIEIETIKARFDITFARGEPLMVQEETYTVAGEASLTLRPIMSQQEIHDALSDSWKIMADQLLVDPDRFFLTLTDGGSPTDDNSLSGPLHRGRDPRPGTKGKLLENIFRSARGRRLPRYLRQLCC